MKTIIESANCRDALDLGKLSDNQLLKLLKVASSNRVLFIFCKKIKHYDYLGLKGRIPHLIDKIQTQGEKIITQYSQLLKKIKKEFEKNDISFLVVKTDRKVDYILADVDILIEDTKFNKAQELLEQMAKGKKIRSEDERWHYKFNNKIQIDIHKMGTDWYSEAFIDTDTIWENTEQRQFLSNTYQFPSQQNEWIFNVLNIIYEKFTLTYLDLLFFKNTKNINYEEINAIAKKHSWDIGLRIFYKYLHKLEWMYERKSSNQKKTLPFMFPSSDFLKIFVTRFFRFPKESRLSLYFFLYYFYCKLRYWLSGGYRISYVCDWLNYWK